MNKLIELDHYLTLLINGWHSPFWDQFFFLYSKVWVWIPFYIAYIFIIIKKDKKQAWMYVVSMITVILIADQISSGLLKPLVERLRPSHDPLLENTIHIINGYRGGPFGFVSSHAANSTGLAVFLAWVFRNRFNTLCLVLWAMFTAYSRIYLGVHFVGDILGGIAVGVFAALVTCQLLHYMQKRLNVASTGHAIMHTFSIKEIQWPIIVYFTTCVIMLVVSV